MRASFPLWFTLLRSLVSFSEVTSPPEEVTLPWGCLTNSTLVGMSISPPCPGGFPPELMTRAVMVFPCSHLTGM